jgi:hypothetical protein
MTATEKKQAAQSGLRAERLVIALFGNQLGLLDLQDVWTKAGISASLQSVEKREAPASIKRATGVADELAFDFTIMPSQALLIVSPGADQMQRLAAERQRVFAIPDFHSGLNWLCETARGLLDVFPPVFRIGIQVSFLWDFDTAEECGAFIRDRVPALVGEQNLGEDLVFQVNRPVHAADAVINRIVTWSSFPAQVLASPHIGIPPTLATFWMARLAVDVNNRLEPNKGQEGLPKELGLKLLSDIRDLTNRLVNVL